MSAETDTETRRRAAPPRADAAIVTRPRRLALVASLVWAVIVLGYAAGFVGSAPEGRGMVALDLLFFAAVLALPVGLVWLVAFLADELALLRGAVGELTASLPGLAAELATTRAVVASEGPVSAGDIGRAVREALAEGLRAEESERLGRLIEGQEEIRHGLRALIERRGAAPPAPLIPAPAPKRGPEQEPAPPPAEVAEPGVPWDVLVRALDFPRDAEDRAGFRALREANRHSSIGQTLRAAEDLLTLLSGVGVYMDDLEPTPVEPDAWRRYIAGERGSEVAGAGGITDADVLGRTRALLEGDPIFRDTAQHFLRRFDAILAEFVRDADDDALRALIDTRSARAFMLLGRLRGRFG